MYGITMNDNVICATCKNIIPGESKDCVLDERKPCPNCGSRSRDKSVDVNYKMHAEVSSTLHIVTYPQVLIQKSKELVLNCDYSIAILVAHMACEVAVARCLSSSFKTKNLQYLEPSVMEFFNGYNLGNKRHLNFFTALTGYNFVTKPFWSKFMESAKRRNNVMHDAYIANENEANESIEAASALVSYIEFGK